jgi:hypothetical protein
MPIAIIDTPNDPDSTPVEIPVQSDVDPAQFATALNIPTRVVYVGRRDPNGIEYISWPFPLTHVSVADWMPKE